MSKQRCRHSDHSWIIGGIAEWCYWCGAFRRLRPIGDTSCEPAGPWVRPTGERGLNPYLLYEADLRRWSAKAGEPPKKSAGV